MDGGGGTTVMGGQGGRRREGERVRGGEGRWRVSMPR